MLCELKILDITKKTGPHNFEFVEIGWKTVRRLTETIRFLGSGFRGDMRRFAFPVMCCMLVAFFVFLNLAGATMSNASVALSSELR